MISLFREKYTGKDGDKYGEIAEITIDVASGVSEGRCSTFHC
jgi:hypothetical protein